jgi:CheY-like chemotaxis protein
MVFGMHFSEQRAGLDGPALLVELRKTEECRDAPVVFVTANVQQQDRDRYFELGALDVIEKPYEPVELSDRLKVLWAELD